MLYAPVNIAQILEKTIEWYAIRDGDLSEEPQHTWHHSIERKRTSLHASFEDSLSISFT